MMALMPLLKGNRAIQTAAIALGVVLAFAALVLLYARFVKRPKIWPTHIAVNKESYDASGKRLAPVFARGPEKRPTIIADEISVFIRPDYVAVGEYRVEHRSVTLLANRALKESGKRDVVVHAAEGTPYFLVVEVLDRLRRSNARTVWLLTKEPTSEPTEPAPEDGA